MGVRPVRNYLVRLNANYQTPRAAEIGYTV